MHVTVAIVTCDRPHALDQLLNSLLEQTRPPEAVIVIDNGTGDETEAAVVSHEWRFQAAGIELRRYDRDDANLPAGRNKAIEMATGDVISFLDDDTVAPPSWSEGIRRGFTADGEIAAVGGPALAVDETLSLTVDIDTSATNRNRINRYGETADFSRKWVPPRPVRVDLVQGANMSFDLETIRAIGGFDTGYRGYPLFEDVDVMAKLNRRDKTIIYHPDALVYHRRVSRDDSSYWYWYTRNGLYFRRQNMPDRYLSSLICSLFWKEYHPKPVLWYAATALLTRNERSVAHVRGYLHGILDGLTSG